MRKVILVHSYRGESMTDGLYYVTCDREIHDRSSRSKGFIGQTLHTAHGHMRGGTQGISMPIMNDIKTLC